MQSDMNVMVCVNFVGYAGSEMCSSLISSFTHAPPALLLHRTCAHLRQFDSNCTRLCANDIMSCEPCAMLLATGWHAHACTGHTLYADATSSNSQHACGGHFLPRVHRGKPFNLRIVACAARVSLLSTAPRQAICLHGTHTHTQAINSVD